jgi:predicted Na+-dependent transporter
MLKDDNGNSLAFGIVLAGVFMVAASILIGMFLIPWNVAFIPEFNGLIDSMSPAQQTADTFGFYRNVSVAVPVFVLFGLLLWAWVRGLEARN